MAKNRYRNDSSIRQGVQVDGEFVLVSPGETIVAEDTSQIPSVQGFVLVGKADAKQKPEESDQPVTMATGVTSLEAATAESQYKSFAGVSGQDNDTPAEAQPQKRPVTPQSGNKK